MSRDRYWAAAESKVPPKPSSFPFVFGAGIFVEMEERGHCTRCGWWYVRARRGWACEAWVY